VIDLSVYERNKIQRKKFAELYRLGSVLKIVPVSGDKVDQDLQEQHLRSIREE
jgi:hypothetical protein